MKSSKNIPINQLFKIRYTKFLKFQTLFCNGHFRFYWFFYEIFIFQFIVLFLIKFKS